MFHSFSLVFLLLGPVAWAKAAQQSKIASAWYASWHAVSTPAFPVDKVSWHKYTHMTYAFAETSPDVRNVSITDPEVLPQFVAAAHQNGVKALLSVGGWTGSIYWSSAVATPQNRSLFVNALVKTVQQYKLDGLDFDWEYPGQQGLGCNSIVPDDSKNFLSFIQELRSNPVGKGLILTAATAIVPFYGPDGNPLADVSGFAKVLDHIAIMNYDIWGPWSPTVGPNAPLNDTCASPDNQVGSAVSAVLAWEAAGFPRSQIVLGLASYGHSFSVANTDAFVKGSSSQLALYAPFNASNHPAGDAWDDTPGVDPCGAQTTQGGVINFWGLIQKGLLSTTGKPVPTAPYIVDTCSQTPYVYDTKNQVMISFDDARSTKAKGKFIKDQGLKGFSTWEAGGDYNDILLNAARSGVGLC